MHQETGVEEDIVRKLVKVANKIRNLIHQGLEEGVSTRELVYAATLLKSGIPMRDALYSTMIEPSTHDSDLKRSIEEILKNYFDVK